MDEILSGLDETAEAQKSRYKWQIGALRVGSLQRFATQRKPLGPTATCPATVIARFVSGCSDVRRDPDTELRAMFPGGLGNFEWLP
jgi:hypothetical protein